MIIINRKADLTRLCRVENMSGVTFTGEQDGHQFVIEGTRGDEREAFTGTVTGRFIRPDGVSVALTEAEDYAGIDEDGAAWVKLAANCYTVAGPFGLVITHVDGGARTVIYSCSGYVRPGETSEIVDPENIINIDAIMGIIDDMQDALTASTIATAAANAAATGAVTNFAEAYAPNTAYKAGYYVTNAGGMYKITDDITAEENTGWSAMSKDQVTAGSEIADVKNNLDNVSLLVPADVSPTIVKGQRFNPETGASASNSRFCRTNSLIDAETVRAVELASNAYTCAISFYDETGATDGTGFISIAKGFNGLTYLPQGTVKIGLSFYKGGSTMQDSDKTAIAAALNFYGQTDTTLTLKCVPADAYSVGSKLDEIDSKIENHVVFTSWTDPADGKYASFETANLKVTLNRTGTNRQYAVMDCKAGDKFVLKGVASNTGYMRAYIFANDSNAVGADTTAWRADAASSGTKVSDFEVTAPVGATRIYINRTYSSEGNPNSYKLLSSIEYADKRAGNTGLRIVCLGDSIFGNFRTSYGDSKGIPNMVAERTGAMVYNHAFGGTHATTQSWTSPMDFQNLVSAIVSEDFTDQIAYATEKGAGYVARVNDVADTDFDDVDIVTISYGTNDWSGNATPAAYKTALEAGITALATAYPHLRFLLCTPIIRFQHVGSAPIDAETEEDEGTGEVISSDDDRMVNGGGNKLTAYVEAVEEVGRKLHIPVCENYWSLGINLLNYSVYLHGQGETDLTHPCRAGRELIAGHVVDAIKRMQV